jgi:hypothetical protein
MRKTSTYYFVRLDLTDHMIDVFVQHHAFQPYKASGGTTHGMW